MHRASKVRTRRVNQEAAWKSRLPGLSIEFAGILVRLSQFQLQNCMLSEPVDTLLFGATASLHRFVISEGILLAAAVTGPLPNLLAVGVSHGAMGSTALGPTIRSLKDAFRLFEIRHASIPLGPDLSPTIL
jgi:hypothetical protein